MSPARTVNFKRYENIKFKRQKLLSPRTNNGNAVMLVVKIIKIVIIITASSGKPATG